MGDGQEPVSMTRVTRRCKCATSDGFDEQLRSLTFNNRQERRRCGRRAVRGASIVLGLRDQQYVLVE